MSEFTEQEKLEIEQLAREFKVRQRDKIFRFSNEQKLLIVKAYVTNQVNLVDLAKNYGVSRMTIWRWSNKFAAGTMPPTHPGASHPGASAAVPAADANPTSSIIIHSTKPSKMVKKATPVTTPATEDPESLKAEIRRLREQLRMSELKLHVSEVMIEEAEKTFNIQIRKKSGTK